MQAMKLKKIKTQILSVHPLSIAIPVSLLRPLASQENSQALSFHLSSLVWVDLPPAPASGGVPAITINDQVLVASVVHAAQTTVTLNKPTQTAAGQALTFFNVNQNSWREYSLYIGTQPSQGNNFGSVTSATANAAAAAQVVVTYKVSNPYLQVGMNVYDDGVLIGVIATITTANQFSLVNNLAALIANDSILTFSFSVLPSVSVLTIDNRTITFTNPAQGFVLPVSVVQITALAGGLTNIIAVS